MICSLVQNDLLFGRATKLLGSFLLKLLTLDFFTSFLHDIFKNANTWQIKYIFEVKKKIQYPWRWIFILNLGVVVFTSSYCIVDFSGPWNPLSFFPGPGNSFIFVYYSEFLYQWFRAMTIDLISFWCVPYSGLWNPTIFLHNLLFFVQFF